MTKRTIRPILRWFIFCLFLFSLSFSFAQGTLQNGKNLFLENKRKDAKEVFSKLVANPAENQKDKSEAHLWLSFLHLMEDKDLESFRSFRQFFNLSENPYPYLFALWNMESVFGSGTRKTPEELAFFEQIVKDPKAHGSLKALCVSQLGDHYEAKNQFPKAKTWYGQIGSIENWSMAGEFENISESGYDKNYEPITKPEEKAEFINKNGAKVGWYKMKGNRRDKWVDFTYHYFIGNSIIFAQTFLQSPLEQEVVLRVGTSGSLKFWVNDALVMQESEERNNDIDTYGAKVKLNKGYNRLLIQIGSSDIDNSNFMVRLTNESGIPVTGLTHTMDFQPYTKATLVVVPPQVPNFSEEFFREKVKSDPKDVLSYFLLGSAYLKNDKGSDARRALAKALAIAPNCSFIRRRMLTAYNKTENEVDAKITLEWLKQNDPDYLFSMKQLYNEEIEKERYEAAAALLARREKLFGEDEYTLQDRINLAAKEDKTEELIKLIEKAYTKYPENYTFVEMKKNVELKVNKSSRKALAVMQKYLKNNYSYDAQKTVSDLNLGMDEILPGLNAYQAIIDISPNVSNYRYNLGKYYASGRVFERAEQLFNGAIELAPYIYYYWSALGQLYNQWGKEVRAKECYQKALELNPRDFESREQLRKLNKKPEIFSYFDAPDVYSIIRSAPGAQAYPEDNSLVLLDEVQKVVYAGGVSEEKRIFVVKILKQDGIDRWKHYYISHFSMEDYTIEKQEVVKANGSRVEGNVSGDEIVFSNLEVGDAIHVTYRLKSFNRGKLASHFWETFYFQYFTPYLTTRYHLLVDKSNQFKYKFSKENIEPKTEAKEDFIKYTWEKLNQSALPFEDKMPMLVDAGNILYISSLPDWTFVSNWYSDLAAAKSKVNLDVQEAVDKVFEGKGQLTDLQKARLIYEYITGNIKYISVSFLQSGLIPQKASHVINSKLGDCKDVSTLFVAMCKAVGIKAELVLVATRDQGKNQLLLPSIDFNHCIARLETGGKEYFIELTSDKLPFNSFFDNLKNASVLVIQDEANGKKSEMFHLNPPVRKMNTVVRNTEMKFEDNNILIRKNNVKTGVFASNMRSSFRDLGPQDQMKDMQKAISGDYNQTTLTALKFNNLNGVSDSVNYQYDFKALESVTEIGGMQIATLPWSERAKSSDFNFSADRQWPIDLWYYDADLEEENISITLPPKMTLADMPMKTVLTCPVAEYIQEFSLMGNKVTGKRKFRFLKDQVGKEELKDFETFYRKVVAADSRQIAMKAAPEKPAAVAPKPAAKK